MNQNQDSLSNQIKNKVSESNKTVNNSKTIKRINKIIEKHKSVSLLVLSN